MLRGLFYGSYRKPRELVWIFGVAIFLSLMGEAFFGYLLPWGQMSYWGAQVIVNLFSAIPFIGPDLAIWIRGDYVVSDATLNRFFAFHVIAIPLVILGLVVAHIPTTPTASRSSRAPKTATVAPSTASPSTPTTRCMTSWVWRAS
jgi:ubiquinol-cytochrome c reductase cytochrome b subunit